MRFTAKTAEGLSVQLEREFDRLAEPGRPMGVYRCATADLPPAADYPFCVLFDTTAAVLKTSDGVNWV